MSGHSKWSTIKRQKGIADTKRGMTFTKLSNSITFAARSGNSGDPLINSKLREALESARKVNMPRDNIQRAIDKGLGKIPGQILEEAIYEGFGPCRVAYIIETVTDNKNRTYQEIRNLFDRVGGAIAGQGSVAYMFERKGELKVASLGKPSDDEMLELIDLGAEDVEDFEETDEVSGAKAKKYLIYTDPELLNIMSKKVIQYGYKIEESMIIYKPTIAVDISDQPTANKVIEFTEKLEGHDDIHKVYANFNISDRLM